MEAGIQVFSSNYVNIVVLNLAYGTQIYSDRWVRAIFVWMVAHPILFDIT